MNLATLLTAFAVLAATPAPAPTTAPTEAPLREIGRVRATTPLCKTLAGHAVAAADLALTSDREITFTLTTLRGFDFDKNIIVKNRGSAELRREYVALHAATVQGDAEMKKFREAIKSVQNDEQRAALEKFADALDGALFRQKKLADDMSRYIAWLDSQQPLTDGERVMSEREAAMRNGVQPADPAAPIRQQNPQPSIQPPPQQNPFGNDKDIPETLSHASKRAADEVETRATLIFHDEDAAAERIDPAFKGC